jgi:phosphonoacetate hydrolase
MGSLNQQQCIQLHGRKYKLPSRPVVVVCIDGFDPEYLQVGCEDGILPTMFSWVKNGFHETAKGAMPALTNPNNLSIITGAPTAVHGISGNYYLDRETGEEHMVLDDSTMHGSTILELMGNAGVRVAAVTAKDKLRKIINHGLSPANGAICFSAQHANQCTMADNGIENVEEWLGKPTPLQYSGDLSIFVLDAGVKLLQENRADLLYLTLSDYIQHKHAPGSPEANEFMQAIDTRLGQLEKLGAVVAVTGDHGMADKMKDDGSPNILFLEDCLHSKWPEARARVICPITDPFIKHHGALGGFVRVHLLGKFDASTVEAMLDEIRKLSQVEVAYTGAEASALMEMPQKREGEMVVIGKKNAVIGSRQDEHDLSQLGGHRLRSHGAFSEQDIPLIRSLPLGPDFRGGSKPWRNFDVFDVALNG